MASQPRARRRPLVLTRDQFDALVVGLPWQRLEQMRVIYASKTLTNPAGGLLTKGTRSTPGGGCLRRPAAKPPS